MKIIKNPEQFHCWEHYAVELPVEYRQSYEEGLDIEPYKDIIFNTHALPASEFKEELAESIAKLVNEQLAVAADKINAAVTELNNRVNQFIDDVNEGVEVSYYADDAVYLSSTGFYNLPGFSEFPSDTLVCLRNLSDYTLSMNKKSAKAHFEAAEEVLGKILNYKK